MSEIAGRILNQFRKLSLTERREVVEILLREAQGGRVELAQRRTLDDVLGKFQPLPEPEMKDHNYWFAQSILGATEPGGKS